MFCAIVRIVSIFLSTLSLRRATVSVFNLLMGELNFYPRSPCGERLYQWRVHQQHKYFYPRSPCGERQAYSKIIFLALYFYPRSPCGERLNIRQIQKIESGISIHALLAESDFKKSCEGISYFIFLSTLSLRRATFKLANYAIYY